MAQVKVTADLNGGDDQTPMSKLVFQIQDGDTSAILPEATYAKIGSVDVAGSDSNITLTLNPTGGAGGLGEIIIDGVDIGVSSSIAVRCRDEALNESDLSPSSSVSSGKKLVFGESLGQYAVGTGAVVPAGDMTIEVDCVTDIGTNNKITYSGLAISRLNATQIYFGIGGGFDVYPLTPAEMVGKNIKFTWNNTTFVTSLLVDDVPVTIDSTSGTKGDADTTLSIGMFITQTGDDTEVSGFKIYKGATLENNYDFDPETETTTLEDIEGTQNLTITVGTGTIGDMWVDL